MLRSRAEETPDFPLVQEVGRQPVTASEVHLSALRLASAMDRFRISPGDRVAVMLRPSSTALCAWIAASWLRAWEVPVNPDYKGAPLVHFLNDSKSILMLVDIGSWPAVASIAPQLTDLRLVVAVGGDVPAPLSGIATTTLEDFVADARDDEKTGPRESDPYAVVYTSGTTGPSKGVLRPWGGLHESRHVVFPDDISNSYEAPAVYAPWPTFHSSGKTSSLIAIQRGMRLIVRSQFSLSRFWEEVREHNCTHALLVSTGARLWKARKESHRDTSMARCFGLPLFPEAREFEEFFGVRLSSGWGMTEIGLPLGQPRPTSTLSCGRPVDGFEMRVVDEHDYEVKAGQVGELIVRHRDPWRIAIGYLDRPEESHKAWRNGWFHTGDALRVDNNGDYYFVDRLKDYIRYRGNNISSREVEAEVDSHPAVAQSACVGVRASTAQLGDEEVKVFVKLKHGTSLTAPELCAYLESRLPDMMLPRFVEFVDALPVTPTEKVRKVELRQRALGSETWDRLAPDRSDAAATGPAATTEHASA
jgi:crotonobetaine/carnitine-CoA ligase